MGFLLSDHGDKDEFLPDGQVLLPDELKFRHACRKSAQQAVYSDENFRIIEPILLSS